MLFGNTADDICIAECALQEFILPKKKAATKQLDKLFFDLWINLLIQTFGRVKERNIYPIYNSSAFHLKHHIILPKKKTENLCSAKADCHNLHNVSGLVLHAALTLNHVKKF